MHLPLLMCGEIYLTYLLRLNWISSPHKESFTVQALGRGMYPIEFFDLGLFGG